MFLENLEKIIIISIISISVLITCLFIIVNIRRYIKHVLFKKLDRARIKYREILSPLLINNSPVDYKSCYSKKGSVEWRAVEDVLFQAMSEGLSKKEVIIDLFEKLEYIDSYIYDLSSGKRFARAIAAEKLGRLQVSRATEHLVRAMDDPVRDVRTVAARSLGNIKDQRAVAPLIEKLVSAAKNPDVLPLRVLKTSIARFVGDASPLLVPLLQHDSWKIRGQAADILGEMGSMPDATPLFPLLGDTQPDVRIKGVKALARVRHPYALGPLTALIKDPSWIVRLQVAKTLGCLGTSEVVPPLIELMSDLHWQVREAAVRSINNIGSMASPALLKVLLLMKDRYAREEVIAELLSTDILDAQFNLLCSPNVKERETASLLLIAAGNSGAWNLIADNIKNHRDPCVRKRLIPVINLVVNDDTEKVLREVSEKDPDKNVREAARSAIMKAVSSKQ